MLVVPQHRARFPGNPESCDGANPDAGADRGDDTTPMQDTERPKTRAARAPQPLFAASIGVGIAFLALLAAFALAFERPSAIGWGGFAIVGAVVLAITIGIGQFLARSSRWMR